MLAECVALGLFLAGLGLCIVTGIQILYALLSGLLCFSVYCLAKGYSARETGSMLWEGISQVRNILIIFVFIGGLTAVWRISGTHPLYPILCGRIHTSQVLSCSAPSSCVSMFLPHRQLPLARQVPWGHMHAHIAMQQASSPFLTGGAILSGSFFGDRCSPMSSSAQLICSLTRTDIYQNIKLMCRSSAVPLAVTCILYVVLASGSSAPADREPLDLFRTNFSLHWAAMLPAVLILVLSLLRVDVKYAMSASIAAGAAVALFVQGTSPLVLLRCFLNGYEAQDGTRLAQLLNGGGIRSMVKVGIIVLISASYSGIFSHTCLLSGVKHALLRSARRLTPFGTVLVTSVLSCAVSCNQSLATILTCQMCDGLYPKKEKLALALEDTAILIAALIPWGIAGTVPVAAIGAPMGCMFYAFTCIWIPLWNLITALYHDRIRAGRTAFTSFM